MSTLSILIPARNEMFLGKTIENLLENIEGDTEIIAVCDGYTVPIPDIPKDPRVHVIRLTEAIGQRAATNLAAKMSKAKYLMKIDAHCAVDKGFDVKMMEVMQDDWTMVPVMRNLHAFDWVCEDGHRRYQGPSGPCQVCGKPTHKDILWIGKKSPQSTSYCFDSEPHFQYFNEYKAKQVGDLVETMSLQGSCFMLTRDKYWELNICDEEFGSWGSQGIEVAVKTWLSGGKVMVNKKTWYAHMFRTQGGDFSFPYQLSGKQVSRAKKHAKDLFFSNSWPKQKYPLSWLVEKFWPVPGWTEKDLADIKRFDSVTQPVTVVAEGVSNSDDFDFSVSTSCSNEEITKSIIYYTDNRLNLKLARKVQNQLKKIGLPIVSASLKPMDFGHNIVVDGERGYLTMFRQILAALEASTADIVFFCEHDVLYHPSHFDFTPPDEDIFYYNTNVWKTDMEKAFRVDDCRQVSGLCCYRELALEHYLERVKQVEQNGFSMKNGFEPGTRSTRNGGFCDYGSDFWESEKPNLDIRHENNLTKTRWSPEEFRNKKYADGWIEKDFKSISWL